MLRLQASSDTCSIPRKNSSAGSDLNILCLNCCGIKSRVNYPEFKDIIDNHEIVCLAETKTDDIDVINLPGYEFKMKKKTGKKLKTRSGSIIVGYKEHLKTMIEIIDTEYWFRSCRALSIIALICFLAGAICTGLKVFALKENKALLIAAICTILTASICILTSDILFNAEHR
ncbi:unnamed protein product [Mytilus edulis]|uniref:Transmembrane protein n=1 Tax=Mytilus edulis TaxID=6550 RepID=A0A8S3VC38_MYTED|nr:unnamed protein product [Mytilus edulis]